jgi:hypothetical protein
VSPHFFAFFVFWGQFLQISRHFRQKKPPWH